MSATPGPWAIDWDHTHGEPPFTICRGNMATGMDWEAIASVKRKEDAHLIAAVWDLRTALEGIMDLATAGNWVAGVPLKGDDAIAAAEAAIAKAYGPDAPPHK